MIGLVRERQRGGLRDTSPIPIGAPSPGSVTTQATASVRTGPPAHQPRVTTRRESVVRTGPSAHQPRTSVRSADGTVGLTTEVGGFARLNHRLTSGGHRLTSVVTVTAASWILSGCLPSSLAPTIL